MMLVYYYPVFAAPSNILWEYIEKKRMSQSNDEIDCFDFVKFDYPFSCQFLTSLKLK